MLVNTVLFDFTVDLKEVKNKSQLSVVAANIEKVLERHFTNLRSINKVELENGNLRSYSGDSESIVNVRIFKNGLITINIEYYLSNDKEQLFTTEKCKKLETDVRECMPNIVRSSFYVPIKRGTFSRYYYSSDGRLQEYDIDKVVFEEHTPYQKVQIMHSKSLGNILVLDDNINMSEADLIYTETLMARGKENYEGKEIVILGGGDGSLLYELLKEKPKNVIMLEIDKVVMEACSKHMSSICGDVLDKKSGDHYQIIVGDCMESLNQYIKEGHRFDYVFGDLTEIPISDDSSNEVWNFLKNVLSLIFKILKPGGKFMTHVNGSACEEAIQRYQLQLTKLNPSILINRSEAYIPSFMEAWVFFQITFP